MNAAHKNSIEKIAPDKLLVDIADYLFEYRIESATAIAAAHLCFTDSLGNALEALDSPACVRFLGTFAPGTVVPYGARVPGTAYLLDPVAAAFNISCMIRWTDYSDTFIAATSCHPSDDIGAVLATADHLSRSRVAAGRPSLRMHDVLESVVQAHELQGVLGMGNAFNDVGIDTVLMTKVACAAVVAKLLGGNRDQVIAATSLAFFQPGLCVHRFGSNTGSRKSWAGGEAASDGVRLALMAVRGEPGYPQVLTHEKWGFSRSFMRGKAVKLGQTLDSYVIENVIFKIAGPATMHAQSAIECALKLYPMVKGRLDDIAEIRIISHRRALSTINKTGPLRNAADRDHSLQYPVAITLLFGQLTSRDYEDDVAADPRIDRLRSLMKVLENTSYTESYFDRARGADSTAIEVRFQNGDSTGTIEVAYPLGHPRRREESRSLLISKFERNLARHYTEKRKEFIMSLCLDQAQFLAMSVHEFTDTLAVS